MADLENKKLFNGIVLTHDESKLANDGNLYFVRTNDEKTDGYLYINGKKYGTGANLAKEVVKVVNGISANTDNAVTLDASNINVASAITNGLEGENLKTIVETGSTVQEGLEKIYDEIKSLASSNWTDLEYVSTSKTIYLKNAAGTTSEVGIDASDFIKDGMLSDAKLVTEKVADGTIDPEGEGPWIYLLWNLDPQNDGDTATKEMYVSVKSLVDIYTVGDDSTTYLEINDNKIDVKVDVEDGLASYNALKELEGDTIKSVNGVEADENNEVVIDSEDINLGKDLIYSGTTIATTANTIGEAFDGLVDEIIKNEQTTAAALNDLNDRIDNLGTDDVKLSTDITVSGNTKQTSGATTTSILQDIYEKLGAQSDAAYTGVTSSTTITVTENADKNGQTIEVKISEEEGNIITSGTTDNPGLFAAMYYGGDDAE